MKQPKKKRGPRLAPAEPISPRGRLDVLAVRGFHLLSGAFLHPHETAILTPHVESLAAKHLTPGALRKRFPKIQDTIEAACNNPELVAGLIESIKRRKANVA